MKLCGIFLLILSNLLLINVTTSWHTSREHRHFPHGDFGYHRHHHYNNDWHDESNSESGDSDGEDNYNVNSHVSNFPSHSYIPYQHHYQHKPHGPGCRHHHDHDKNDAVETTTLKNIAVPSTEQQPDKTIAITTLSSTTQQPTTTTTATAPTSTTIEPEFNIDLRIGS